MKTRWREYIQTTHAGFSEHIRISCIIALFLFLSRQGLAENRVMLVGVDGATWTVIGRLIEKGELPAFKRLTDEGSYMPRFNTMGSTVSPVVWTSVATGRLPKDHGILGFTERLPSGKVIPISGNMGYPLDSGDPNILWLGSRGLSVPVGDDRSIRRWVHGDCLLHKAVEEFSPAA